MNIIQGGQLTQVYSTLNAQAAQKERTNNPFQPYIDSPYPTLNLTPGQSKNITIFVDNVYFGASVQLGNLIQVNGVKYYKNINGFRQEVQFIDVNSIDPVNEIVCNVTLLGELVNNTVVPLTITNPNIIGDVDLGGLSVTDDKNFIVNRTDTDDDFFGDLTLNITTNNVPNIGFLHINGLTISDNVGAQQFKIPYSQLKDKSISVELRDKDCITEWFYRISLERLQTGIKQYVIFIERWDAYDNTYIEKLNPSDINQVNLYFEIVKKDSVDKTPKLNIINIPNKIVYNSSKITVNYSAQYTTNIKYDIYGWKNNTWETIIQNQYFKTTVNNDVRLNVPNNIKEIDLPTDTKKYNRIKVSFRGKQLLKYITTGTDINNPGTNDFEERWGSPIEREIDLELPTIVVNPSTVNIGFNQSQINFSVTADSGFEWTVEKQSDVDWIQLDNLIRNGTQSVSFIALSNPNNLNRTTVLTVRSRLFPNITAQVTVIQAPAPQNSYSANFYFDVGDSQFQNLGPFPNTKEGDTVVVPYYVDEGTGEILRTTDIPILLRQRILSSNEVWNRTNPIKLIGTIQTATNNVQDLNFAPVNNESELQDNQFFVNRVRFNFFYQDVPFWSNTNLNFLPIPQTITRFNALNQVVSFSIKYKVGGKVFDGYASYRLDGIFVRKPIFNVNPSVQSTQVNIESNALFNQIKDVLIKGETASGVINPSVVQNINGTDRNIFVVDDIKFYRNYNNQNKSQVDYVNFSRQSTIPNQFSILASKFFDNSIQGVAEIRYKNVIGDITNHTIHFIINRVFINNPSTFTVDPQKYYINVNKEGTPLSTGDPTVPEIFPVLVNGFETNPNNPNTPFRYTYTPFEPGSGMFTISFGPDPYDQFGTSPYPRGIRISYTNQGDLVKIRDFSRPGDERYGLYGNIESSGTGNVTINFFVDVYKITAPIFVNLTLRYRKEFEVFNDDDPLLDDSLTIEIIPNNVDEPKQPPPGVDKYVVSSAATPTEIIIDVDCNNQILNDSVPSIDISAIQRNINTNETKNLEYSSSDVGINKGQYRITNISSIPSGLNISSLGRTLNLAQDTLSQNYKVKVELEYKDDNSNSGILYNEISIKRRDPQPYLVNFYPDPSTVSVSVDYDNEIIYVSSEIINITAIETNPRDSSNKQLTYTTNNLSKGTFKIKKISGFVSSTTIPNNNQISLIKSGRLDSNTNVLVYLDYMDNCGAVKNDILVTIPVNRTVPRGQDVFATLNPENIDVYVDFRFSLVQDPMPENFPIYTVKLTENEIGTTAYSSTLTATESDNLLKSQFKILKVYDSSQNKVIEKYRMASPSTFVPFVKKMLKSEIGFVDVRYKDLSGKEGTKTLQFNLNRVQLPRKYSRISITTPITQQIVIVSDKFEIIDQTYDEIKNIPVLGSEILSNGITEQSLKFVKLNKDQKLIDDSTYTINSVYAYDESTNKFIDNIGFDITDTGEIIVLANEILSNVVVKINTSYIDFYGNDGTIDIISRILPQVTPPLITRIEYPEGINAQDYIGFDEDFEVIFESEFTSNVSIYVNVTEKTYGENSFYGKYYSDDTAKFNMQDLINRYSIDTGEENDTFTFTLVLVPDRLEPNGTILLGQIEVIEIQFNKSDIQIPRPFIINNLNTVIKPKFDFTVYKDEVAWYLNHYLHFDDEEPRLIANWERDDITFTEFELDELGNEIPTQVNPTLVLKMYEPIPEDISVNKSVWISKQRS